MGWLKLRFTRQIRNCARQLQHPVIDAYAPIHLLGGAHEVFARFIQLAKQLDIRRPHVAVD
jgi:hypothetical protein